MAESYLGELRKGKQSLTVRGLEALILGVAIVRFWRRAGGGPYAAAVRPNALLLGETPYAEAASLRAAPPRSRQDPNRLKPGQEAWRVTLFLPAGALSTPTVAASPPATRRCCSGSCCQAGRQISFSSSWPR